MTLPEALLGAAVSCSGALVLLVRSALSHVREMDARALEKEGGFVRKNRKRCPSYACPSLERVEGCDGHFCDNHCDYYCKCFTKRPTPGAGEMRTG
jgi:hypothetical protein